jgi:hypothetical protein
VPGISSILTYTAIEGLLLLFLVIIIEYIPYVRQRFLYYHDGRDYQPQAMTLLGDADVHNEREKVMAGWDREYVVVIRNLSKIYGPLCGSAIDISKRRAIYKMYLAIPRGEIFGFVGVSGKYLYIHDSGEIAWSRELHE